MAKRIWGWLSAVFEWMLTALPGKGLAAIAFVWLVGSAAYLLYLPESEMPTGDKLGWYGVFLGIFGVWYTVSQLYKTQEAVQAAANANRQAGQIAFQIRIENAGGYIRGSQTGIDGKNWKFTCFRLREAADELRCIRNASENKNRSFSEVAQALDLWDTFFRDGVDGRLHANFNDPKKQEWNALYHDALTILEIELGDRP